MEQQMIYGHFMVVPLAFQIYWRDIINESKHKISAENLEKTNIDLRATLVDGRAHFFLNVLFDNGSSKRINLDGGDGIEVELCPDELRNVLTESKEVLMIKLNSTEVFDF